MVFRFSSKSLDRFWYGKQAVYVLREANDDEARARLVGPVAFLCMPERVVKKDREGDGRRGG